MNTQRSVASFLLRFTQDLWQDENGDPRVQWRGHIDHVQGKESIPFVDFSEAMLFMQQQLQELTLGAFPTTDPQMQEKLLKESFKLWEAFARSYTEMILQTLGQTIERSQAIQEQVGETIAKSFRLWLPPAFRSQPAAPASSQEADLPGLIQDLADQVNKLNEKIKLLEAKNKE